jgi:hypothetical protein
LSFSLNRIVIKAGPPFLIVYTNAAYTRLSGIDSHAAVGKPISTLLSIPDQDALAEVIAASASAENAAAAATAAAVAGVAKHPSDKGQQEQNGYSHFGAQNTDDDAHGHTYVAAEAAGRARAAASQEEENSGMCLERLVAASGFGRCHVIHVLAKPHHMVGRNVSVPNKEGGSAVGAGIDMDLGMGEARGNGSSINSGALACSMSVSPVVSSPEAIAAVVTDKDQDNHSHKSKRRKYHHHSDSQQQAGNNHHQHRRNFLMREVSLNRKKHLITHYVIQLEPFEGTFRKFGSLESHSSSSTTAEAHILGLTKSELRRQRMRNQVARAPAPEDLYRPPDEEVNDGDEMESESSSAREPVTAIG